MPTSLNELGITAATDKSSLLQDYLRHYEYAFQEWRDEPINIIEIGVLSGASLKLWPEYFSRARIIGIDITPEVTRFATDRVEIRIGSQDDRNFMLSVCSEFPPTIVIDDGSHRADHNKSTFETVFPRVCAGGVYVIEDLDLHFGSKAGSWAGEAKAPPQEFIHRITDHILSTGFGNFDGEPDLAACAGMVESTTVIPRAALFRKKRIMPPTWETSWDLIEKAGNAYNWYWLSTSIERAGDAPRLAAMAAKNASDLAPDDFRIRTNLAKMLEKAGRLEEAKHEARYVLDHGTSWRWLVNSRAMLERILAR